MALYGSLSRYLSRHRLYSYHGVSAIHMRGCIIRHVPIGCCGECDYRYGNDYLAGVSHHPSMHRKRFSLLGYTLYVAVSQIKILGSCLLNDPDKRFRENWIWKRHVTKNRVLRQTFGFGRAKGRSDCFGTDCDKQRRFFGQRHGEECLITWNFILKSYDYLW